MFQHLYRFRLKILLQRRDLLFWTLMFPLILGWFFQAAFGNIDNAEVVTASDVAFVGQATSEENQFAEALGSIDNQGTALFKPVSMSEKAALQALEEGEVSGIYYFSDQEISLQINSDQTPQKLLQAFLDQFLQQQDLLAQITATGQTFSNEQLAQFLEPVNYLQADGELSANDQKSFYFFTLIGMACMFGFLWGLKNSVDEQADKSARGIRFSLIPANKLLVNTANTCAAFTIFFVEILLVIGFFNLVYQVNFGSRWQWILVVTALGSYNALVLGAFLANRLKIPLLQQENVGLALTMLMSLFAGMFGSYPRDLIAKYLPFLNYLNPVNLISESFYQLLYYQSLDSFYINLFCLIALAALLSISEFLFERRAQYEYL
ncbi:ABC transporter permease [Enterococcus sp. HY326]|uniref:ABC transporter permease n=1 Tax=Enterococcus sp. HY326 TaxID=2971265 RepID=UPI00223F5769|nr:ABC transporter permease [Enterococcus sp. HY326]